MGDAGGALSSGNVEPQASFVFHGPRGALTRAVSYVFRHGGDMALNNVSRLADYLGFTFQQTGKPQPSADARFKSDETGKQQATKKRATKKKKT